MEWRHTHTHAEKLARRRISSFLLLLPLRFLLLFLLLLLLLLLLGSLLLPQAGHQLVREERWNRQRECDEVSTSCVRRTLKYAGTPCMRRMLKQAESEVSTSCG